MFSDKAMCHLSGHTNKHNIKVWSSIILQVVIEGIKDSLKFSVFCVLFQQNLLLLLDTVAGVLYLDMFKDFLMIVLKNRALMKCCCSKACCRKPLHFHIAVQAVLNRSLHRN